MHEHSDGRADWDHNIFVAGCAADFVFGERAIEDLAPAELPVPLAKHVTRAFPKDRFRKLRIKGTFPNQDIVVDVGGAAPPRTTGWWW